MPQKRSAGADLTLEETLWSKGYLAIAGVDEVGRGAWAGPVMAAAVLLPPDRVSLASLLGSVDDSKRLTAASRVRLSGLIREYALGVGVGNVAAGEIDRLGIAAATRLAMLNAIESLPTPPDFVLVDFMKLPELRCPQLGVPHGDATSLAIAAASVVAKVTRDHWMASQEAQFPGYGFSKHKGYGTPQHAAALARLGPSVLHRRSFRPVAALADRTSRLKDQSGVGTTPVAENAPDD